MQANKAITHIRALLRDDEYERLHISDRAILERLSAVQNDLIAEFGENIHILKLEASEQLELEAEIARIYSITLDGREIPTAIFAKAWEMQGVRFTHYDGNRYGVLGLKGEQGRALKICASLYARTLGSASDELALGEAYARALALGVLCEFLLIETHPQNLQKLQFYRAEYERAKGTLRAGKNRAMNPPTLYTRAQA